MEKAQQENPFQPYHLQDLLDQTGIITVYRASGPRNQSAVVKLLQVTSKQVPSSEYAQRVRAILAFSHPAAVPVLQQGETDKDTFFIQPWMEGGSLKDRLDRSRPMVADILPIMRRIIPALETAHRYGIIHQWLQPSKILFDSQDQAYLADTGFANLLRLASPSFPIHPPYISPEAQAVGSETRLSPAMDVYSLGAIIFEMSAGRSSPLTPEVFDPERFRMALDTLPDSLRMVIERACMDNPADRYRTPTDLLIALEQAQQDMPLPNSQEFFPPPPESISPIYSLEITRASLPDEMAAGRKVPLSFTMVNHGSDRISSSNGFSLHLNWTEGSDQEILKDEIQVYLDRDLPSGASYTWSLPAMNVPDAPGQYTLLLQLTTLGEPDVLASYRMVANIDPPFAQEKAAPPDIEAAQSEQRDFNLLREKQAYDLQQRIGTLEKAFKQDERLPDPFRKGIDSSLSIARVSLESGDLSSADTFLSVAEKEYESWRSQPEAWESALSDLFNFMGEIDISESGGRRAVAYLDNISQRGPTLETPENFNQVLLEAKNQVDQYLRLYKNLQKLESKVGADLPEVRELHDQLEKLPLGESSQALNDLEARLKEFRAPLSRQGPSRKGMEPEFNQAAQSAVGPDLHSVRQPVESSPAWEQEVESRYWELTRQLNEMKGLPASLNAEAHRLLEAVLDKADDGDEEKARQALSVAVNVIETWAAQPEAWQEAAQTMDELRREAEDFPEVARRSVRSSLVANYNRMLGSGSPGDLKAFLENASTQTGLYQTALDELNTLEDEAQREEDRQTLARIRRTLEKIRPRDTNKIYPLLEDLDKMRQTLNASPPQTSQAEQTGATSQAPVVTPVTEAETSTTTPAASTLTSGASASGNGHPPEQIQPPTAIQPSITVVYTPPEPPKKEHSLRLTVRANKVDLEYQGKLYSSQNLLKEQDLLYAEYEGPQTYGEALFRGLIHDKTPPGSPEPSTTAGYAVARDLSKGHLRMELRVDDFPTACRWEYLKDPSAPLPFSVREQAPFYRLYSTYQAELVPADPLRILVVLANPSDLGQAVSSDGKPVLPVIQSLVPLQENIELEVIRGSTRKLVKTGLAEVEILPAPASLDAIKEKLQEKPYHVLHIIAHGVFIQSQQKYYIVLENGLNAGEEGAGPPGSAALVPASAFDETLWDCGVRLVVLSACQSGNLGLGSSVLPAIAPQLMQNRLSSVIAMQGDLPFKAAQLFHARFYDDLARTGRIDMALAATRYDLYRLDMEGWTWGLPLLLMSTSDGKLFNVNEARASHLHRPNLEELDLPEAPAETSLSRTAVANALNQQLQRFGLPGDPGLIQSLLAGPAGFPTREAPLAARQDRSVLNRLASRVSLQARELQEYVRSHSGIELDDRTFDQIASTLNAGKHLILIGPPGSGKTSLSQDICQYASGLNVTTGVTLTTATSDWTTFDTVGGYVPTRSGILQFRPGIFLEAIRLGSWLVIDEINRAEIDKAFGELFTVLSGQQVDLPWEIEGENVRVLPPVPEKDRNPLVPGSWAQPAAQGYSYCIHPNWRIIGTMNVYDKSSLYQMSFAFMRRFAFVDVDLPADDTYFSLIDRWLTRQKLKNVDQEELVIPGPELEQTLQKMLQRKEGQNPLMQRRALGPAIVKDMIEYAGDRYRQAMGAGALANPQSLLIEAFLLYVVSQLDGLDYEGIRQVYTYLYGLFHDLDADECERVLTRIRLLYPHIPANEWETG